MFSAEHFPIMKFYKNNFIINNKLLHVVREKQMMIFQNEKMSASFPWEFSSFQRAL